MKIRIAANSLRFRVREPEVAEFKTSGELTEEIILGPAPEHRLQFCLEVQTVEQLTLRFEANKITVGVPVHLAGEWSQSAMVGFDGKVDTGDGNIIELLVERDFACTGRNPEENKGAYPNPKVTC